MKSKLLRLSAALLLLNAMALTANAATLTVTSLADSGPGTLRTALATAATGDTIDGTGVSGTILLTSGELVVTNSMGIFGPGPAVLSVNGNHASRVFYIGSNAVVSLSGLMVTNGFVTGPDFLADSGAGILNDHATLSISNCAIEGNLSQEAGGGIFNNSFNPRDFGDVATLTILDSTISVNSASAAGGGIYNYGGFYGATLTIRGCTVTGNSAQGTGGGIFSVGSPGSNGTPTIVTIASSLISNNAIQSGNGGGIFNAGFARMTLANTAIVSNSVTFGAGGGVLNEATMIVTNCTVSGNSSMGGGIQIGEVAAGGIVNSGWTLGATLTLASSTVNANSAVGGIASGGGIVNIGGIPFSGGPGGRATAMIVDSTISSNVAPDIGYGGILAGGGVVNLCGDFGSATLTIANSTLSSNSAAAGGGIAAGGVINAGSVLNAGRYGGSSALTIVNSTLSDNTVRAVKFVMFAGGILNDNQSGNATLKLGSTILNAGGSGSTITNDSGTISSLGYNLSSDNGAGFLTATGDQINTDPMLGPLQDNGGPTFTHTLLCGSPAIDKGKDFSGSLYDQCGAGFVRTFDDPFAPNAPGGDGTDIGAFEVQTSCNQPPVARCRDVTVSADATCTANVSVDNGSSDPDGDRITMVQSPPGPYPLGTNVVTLTVTDSHGASNSCTALVIVQDTTPPNLTCPTDITQDATSPGGAVVSFSPLATDDCSGPPVVTSVPASNSTFPIGTTTVVCTATDLAGNSASCEFQVTVLGPREMLQRLLALVNAQAARPQPLRVTLEAALASLDRGNSTATVNQLQAFQHKVQAQVAPSDPVLAQTLIQTAGRIIALLQP
jgi:hypothetical protein